MTDRSDRARRGLAIAGIVVLTAATGASAADRSVRGIPVPAAVAAPVGDPMARRYVDYAPEGMPDFSQCRGPWSRPGDPGQWTHAGPVALADALWWLDSVAEPGRVPPPAASDGHALVTAYPRFGPARDDHDASNVGPLVEDLALRANTNGVRDTEAVRGTRWEDLVAAADAYLSSRRRAAPYRLVTTAEPDTSWLDGMVASGGAIVLAVGIWEELGDGSWKRVGGHYAALAGWVPGGPFLDLADPLADAAAFGGAGRAVPDDRAAHGCREAPGAHDDAAFVSHDRYRLQAEPSLPGGRQILAGYFTPDAYRDAAAFAGQNPIDALASWSGPWQRARVVAALDAALGILPETAPTAATTGTATATPMPTTAAPAGTPTAAPLTETPDPPAATWTPTPPEGATTAAPAVTDTSTPGRGTARPIGTTSALLPLVTRSR